MLFSAQLELLAGEIVARKLLESERLKLAELRLQLIEREGRHMCLAPACHTPVIGKRVFAHCERHLTVLEKRWLEEEIESPTWKRPPDDPLEHSVVKAARVLGEQREVAIAKEFDVQKERAIVQAQDLIESNRRSDQERIAFLPAKLRLRIDKAYETLTEDYADAPPSV